jgi:hypothetical protein
VSSVELDAHGSRTLSSVHKNGYEDSDWKVKVDKHVDASSSYTTLRWGKLRQHRHVASVSTETWDPTRKAWDVVSTSLRDFDLTNYSRLGVTVTDNVLKDQALARFKRKLSGKVGSAKLLIPSVELRELHGSVRAMSETTHKALWNMLDLSRKYRTVALAKRLQEAWLSYSFGISPLVSDFQNAVDAVSNYIDRPSNLARISATATKRWVTGGSSITGNQDYWSIRNTHTEHHYLRYTYVGGIDFNVITGNNYGLKEHLGFSEIWRELPSLAWELTPFSWVFDYFTTVGAYLEDTFVLPPGSTKYLTLTRKYVGVLDERLNVQRKSAYPAGMVHTILHDNCSPGTAALLSMDRSVLSSLPHRSLRFKTVDEIGKHAVNKLLNLCSLVSIEARTKLASARR